MHEVKSRFLVGLLTFGIGVLVVSLWIIENQALAVSIKEPPAAEEAIEKSELTKDTIITLERSVCFGTCPDYKLTISGDGSVVFEGRKFVKKAETVKSELSPEKIRQLIDAFDKANYFSLKDKYESEKDGCPEVWTDNPTVNTSIKINGKSKSIIHYHGCQENSGASVYPKALTELERRIDEIANTKQWIK